MKLVLFTLVVSAVTVAAGTPEPKSRSVAPGTVLLSVDGLPRLAVPQIDAPTLRHRYQTVDRDRISEPADVGVTPQNSGAWESLADGSRMWRLRVSAPGSLTLAMVFENFHLPPDAEMYVSAVSGELVRRLPYTAASNPRDGVFATGPLPSDEAIIEIDVPAAEEADVSMTMTHVNRGFVKLATLVGNIAQQATPKYTEPDTSQECEVNVACSQGQGKFKNAGMGVGMIITPAGRLCSGFLISDSAHDFHQYFQTASHCGAVSGWSIVFDFQSATCARGGPSSLADQVTNIVEVGRNDLSDFLLVDILEPIPPQFNIFYNGFFSPDLVPLSGAAVIHHPGGNVKKISASFEPLADSSFTGAIAFSDWRVDHYDLGMTEAGSSGAPALNADTLVIGQVHGGFSTCDPNSSGPDYFGKFSLSFNSGQATPSQRLRTFLDANGLIPDPNDPVKGAVAGAFPPGSLLAQVWLALGTLQQMPGLPAGASSLLQIAVNHLNNSLNPALWGRGPAALNSLLGPAVFVEAGLAVTNLEILQAAFGSSFPAGAIQTQITNLVQALRSVVTVGLTETGANNAKQVNALLASGNSSAAANNPLLALAQYGVAWAIEKSNPVGSIVITGGNGQMIPVSSSAVPLQILVKDIYGLPMPAGFPVLFMAVYAQDLAHGGGAFSNNSDAITLTTGDGGRIAAAFKANNTVGAYVVNLFAEGVAPPPQFSLSNIAPRPVTSGVAVTQP